MFARVFSATCSSAARTPMIATVAATPPTGRQRRTFAAVKELSWCAKSDSPNSTKNKNKPSLPDDVTERQKHVAEEPPVVPVTRPIRRFGIVGAMSRNRVIGINGKLPWNCPEDRQMFEALTRDKVLIVGRKTFQEATDWSHVSHTAHCIVVSKTLAQVEILEVEQAMRANARHGVPNIHVAPCLGTSLDLARQLVNESDKDTSTNSSDGDDSDTKIDCWIGGGERIFDEALVHPSAFRLILNVVDMDVPLEGLDMSNVARFPPKYRWDNKYKQVSAVPRSSGSLNFTHCIFERIQGSRSR